MRNQYLYADWQHYNNFLIGERATGMGGAYTALSDDPSGIYYNPAGLAFSGDGELSLSTMGYYKNNQTIGSLYGVSDIKLRTNDSDLVNGFFGGIIKFEYFHRPFYFSFGIIVPDNSNIDSKFRILNTSKGIAYTSDQRITDTKSIYLVSLSTKINEESSVGLSLGFFNYDYSELITSNFTNGPFVDSLGRYVYSLTSSVEDHSFQLRGARIGLGSIYKPKDWLTLGASFTYNIPAWQKMLFSTLGSAVIVDSNFNPIGPDNIVLDNGSVFVQYQNVYTSSSYNNAFVNLPYEIRLGLAFYLWENQIFTFDLDYHSKNDSPVDRYDLKPVFNFAFGSETRIFEEILLRCGLFTNSWAGKQITQKQFINSDFIGFTAGVAYERDEKTSYGISALYQVAPNAQYVPPTIISAGSNSDVNWSIFSVKLGMKSNL